ncbi:hypothetical protein [Hansschlegelia sp. KR7-227]|uniref:hypothetical protein n=1 Tax=Hansschlegelia sp. KR7-227 TaxID=3400914 RepID=UPI003C0B306A
MNTKNSNGRCTIDLARCPYLEQVPAGVAVDIDVDMDARLASLMDESEGALRMGKPGSNKVAIVYRIGDEASQAPEWPEAVKVSSSPSRSRPPDRRSSMPAALWTTA